MDGRKPSISPSALCGRVDADVAPTDSAGESSSVTYSGSAISEGFALALRAMGVGADILPADSAPPNVKSNRKDS